MASDASSVPAEPYLGTFEPSTRDAYLEAFQRLSRSSSTGTANGTTGDRSVTETEPDRTVPAENVSELTYEIPVPTGGTVTPEPGLDRVLTDTTRETVYALVQYARPPLDEETTALDELGYERVMGATETTSYARLPTDTLQEIADVSAVRAVTRVRPAWRIDPDFAEQVAGSEAPLPTTVLTFERLPAEVVESMGLRRAGANEVLETGETFTYYGDLSEEEVGTLQDNQRVYWIDGTDRGELEATQGRRMVGASMVANALSGTDYTGQGVKVGVLDTGIAHDHRHFSNVDIVDAKDWGDGDTNPEAPNGCPHGVHVAGTIAGSGQTTWYDRDVDRNVTTTVTGVAPDATLVVSRVFERNSSDPNDCNWATGDVGPKNKYKKVRNKGAKIISNSWSANHDGDYDIPASKTDTWVRHHRDTVVVFSNGNNDPDISGQHDKSPALAKNVISVGAVRDGSIPTGAENVTDGTRFRTNTDSGLNDLDPTKDWECGSFRKKPEVYAPGEWITSAVTGGEYGTELGTSMAAPHVSGVAALFREKYPNTNAAEVRAHLVSTAAPPNLEGYGVVNANNALFRNPYESVQGHFSGRLKKNKSDEKDFTVPEGAEKVVVTLVWTDPGHVPGVGAHVNCDSKGSGILANDLDLYAGPSGDVERYKKPTDTNVKRIVVEDPTNGTWTTRIKAHRVTFLTKQNYEVVYRVVTQDPTLEFDVPDKVVVPPAPPSSSAGNETVRFRIEGTGAPVSGIHGDIETGPNVDFCNKSGEFVAGTLSQGHDFTLSRCLNAPSEPGTYEVELNINTTNADTIAGADDGTRPLNASKTVEIVVPEPTIHVEPYVRNASIGELVTYRVVASNVSDGVGSFVFDADMLDPSVGRFVAATTAQSGGSGTVMDDGKKAEIRASGLDTNEYGNVTLGRMIAEGRSIGASGINLDFSRFEDETGTPESVAFEDDDTTWHAVLNVPTGESTLWVDIPTGGGDGSSIAGPIGIVGEPIPIELNQSSLEDEVGVGIQEVEWDFGDGTGGSGLGTEHAYDEPGNYTVTGEVLLANGSVFEVRRVVEVSRDTGSVDVDAPDTVAPGAEATINVSGDPVGYLTVSGDVGSWTVTDTSFTGTDPLGVQTTPNSSQLPYTAAGGTNWSRFFLEQGDNYFELTVTAPDETGTYDFTATAWNGSRSRSTAFSVEVTDRTSPVDAVPGAVYTAAAGSDGEPDDLTRADVVSSLRSYIRSGGRTVNGADAERSEVVGIVRFYIRQAIGS